MSTNLLKIEEFIPSNYQLQWDGNSKTPIVYRSQYPQNLSTTVNDTWISALRKVTGVTELIGENYVRFNIVENDDAIALSIFPNSTIMLQGYESGNWLSSNIEEIVTLLHEISHEPLTDEDNFENQHNEIVEPKGICMKCDEKDTKLMICCENPQCNSWWHYTCDKLVVGKVKKIITYYCEFCRSDKMKIVYKAAKKLGSKINTNKRGVLPKGTPVTHPRRKRTIKSKSLKLKKPKATKNQSDLTCSTTTDHVSEKEMKTVNTSTSSKLDDVHLPTDMPISPIQQNQSLDESNCPNIQYDEVNDSFLEKLQQITDTQLIPQTPVNRDQESKRKPSRYQDSDPSPDGFEKQKASLFEVKPDQIYSSPLDEVEKQIAASSPTDAGNETQTRASTPSDEGEKQTTASSSADEGENQTTASIFRTTHHKVCNNSSHHKPIVSDDQVSINHTSFKPVACQPQTTHSYNNLLQSEEVTPAVERVDPNERNISPEQPAFDPEILNLMNDEIKALYANNSKLKNDIEIMKLKESEMSAKYEATMDRLALADAELLSECRSSPNDDKRHRLEHRNQKETVKEFKKLEKKYLEVKKQLSETCDEKDKLKLDLAKCTHQRENMGNILEDVMRKDNDTAKLAEAKVLEARAKEELSKMVDTNEKLKEKVKEYQKSVLKLKTSYSTLEKENETLKREKDIDEGIKANNKLLIELAKGKIKTLEDEIAKLVQINFTDKLSPSTKESNTNQSDTGEDAFITINEHQPTSHPSDSRDLNHPAPGEGMGEVNYQEETHSPHPSSPHNDEEIFNYNHPDEEIDDYNNRETVVIYSSKYSETDMASSRIRAWQLIGSPKSAKKKPINQLSAHPITLQNRFDPLAPRYTNNQQPPQSVPTRIDPLQHHHLELRNNTIPEQLHEYRQSMMAIYHNPPPTINNLNPVKLSEENSRQDKVDIRVCPYYLKGNCLYGNRCRNLHPDPTAKNSNTGYWVRGYTPLKTSNTPITSVTTEPQLTNSASRKKSIPCRYFIQNRCKHSKDTCVYSHTHPLTQRK